MANRFGLMPESCGQIHRYGGVGGRGERVLVAGRRGHAGLAGAPGAMHGVRPREHERGEGDGRVYGR